VLTILVRIYGLERIIYTVKLAVHSAIVNVRWTHMSNLEPIRQVPNDGRREQIAADFLSRYNPQWKFYPTPRYYFTDFHMTKLHGNDRENYIGDMEIKWLRIDSSRPAIFPFNKLQNMLIAPPYTDNPEVFHRICFRFTDGTMIVPAQQLAHQIPQFHVRHDTQERDLVVYVHRNDYQQYWKDLVIEE
jgi:hypothetical protein